MADTNSLVNTSVQLLYGQSSPTLQSPLTSSRLQTDLPVVEQLAILSLTCQKYEEENQQLRKEVECSTECILHMNQVRSQACEDLQLAKEGIDRLLADEEMTASVLTDLLKTLGVDTYLGNKLTALELAKQCKNLISRQPKERRRVKLKSESRLLESNENEPVLKVDNLKVSLKRKGDIKSCDFDACLTRGRLAHTQKPNELKTIFQSLKMKPSERLSGTGRKHSLQVRPIPDRPDGHYRTLSSTESFRKTGVAAS